MDGWVWNVGCPAGQREMSYVVREEVSVKWQDSSCRVPGMECVQGSSGQAQCGSVEGRAKQRPQSLHTGL